MKKFFPIQALNIHTFIKFTAEWSFINASFFLFFCTYSIVHNTSVTIVFVAEFIVKCAYFKRYIKLYLTMRQSVKLEMFVKRNQ